MKSQRSHKNFGELYNLSEDPHELNNLFSDAEHEFTQDLLIEAAYTGSRGEHLWQDIPFNAGNPAYLSLGNALTQLTTNPFYGQIATGTLRARTVAASQQLLTFPQYTGINLHN